ncbi:MAG TPA: PfkB family carbohydrate kinase [Actinoplanes sp.]|nr:PfkB family carbohydrate kinase [Actinoplanes sp.]
MVDTTGCGDAFSAGCLRGLSLGQRPEQAAVLGCAAAAQVAAGLGTDHGDLDLATIQSSIAEAQHLRSGAAGPRRRSGEPGVSRRSWRG